MEDIQEAITNVKNRGITILFIWVRSHIGIKGKEEADLAAKEATLMPMEVEKIPDYDIKAIIKGNTKTN